MSAALRFKYARALEVLSSLEADQSHLQRNHETEALEKENVIRLLEKELAKTKASISQLEAALSAASSNEEFASRANTAEKLYSELEKTYEEMLASNQSQVSRLEAVAFEAKQRYDEERKASATSHQEELDRLQQSLLAATARTDKSDESRRAAEAELESLRKGGGAEKQVAAAAEAELRAQLEEALARGDSEEKLRLAAESARAACGEKLALTSSLLRLANAKIEGAEAALGEVTNRAKALSNELAQEQDTHRFNVDALVERVARLEGELASLGGHKFKKFVELKKEKKGLERELSSLKQNVNAGGGGGGSSSSVGFSGVGYRRSGGGASIPASSGGSSNSIERMIDRTSLALDSVVLSAAAAPGGGGGGLVQQQQQQQHSTSSSSHPPVSQPPIAHQPLYSSSGSGSSMRNDSVDNSGGGKPPLTKAASQRRPIPRPGEPGGVGVGLSGAHHHQPSLPVQPAAAPLASSWSSSSFSASVGGEGRTPPLVPKPRSNGEEGPTSNPPRNGTLNSSAGSIRRGEEELRRTTEFPPRDQQQEERGPREFF